MVVSLLSAERFQVEVRVVVTAVRVNAGPFSAEASEMVARDAVHQKAEHGVVVGFGLAGPEDTEFPPDPYKKCFEIAAKGNLIVCPHAGEYVNNDSAG